MLSVSERTLQSHRGYDKHAHRFALALAKQTSSDLVSATWSRLLCDLNRSEGEASLWSRFSEGLPLSEKKKILVTYYRPFRKLVFQKIKRLRPSERKPVLHLSIHSYTPILSGRPRRFHFGILFDPSSELEAALARTIKAAVLRDQPRLKVVFNKPYRGVEDGHTTSLRSQFAGGYAGIELELRQNLSVHQRYGILLSLDSIL